MMTMENTMEFEDKMEFEQRLVLIEERLARLEQKFCAKNRIEKERQQHEDHMDR